MITQLSKWTPQLQAFLSWLGFEQTQEGDPDESAEEALNLQQSISLPTWPAGQSFNSSASCSPAFLQCLHLLSNPLQVCL